MKYLFIFAAVIFGCFARAQQAKSPAFRIEGHVKGIADKTEISLTDANKPGDTIARTSIRAGTFILSGHVNEPNLYVINFAQSKKKTVFIGNENVQITGDISNLTAMQVKGSPSETDFNLFEREFNPLFAQLNQISQLANSQEGAQKRDSIADAYQRTAVQIQMKVDSFILNNKESYVSSFLLVVVNQLSDDIFLLERRLHSLSANVQGGMYGKYLQEQVDNGKVGAIGSEAMDFSQADTSGKLISLSSLKGKYVLVDFWASWCKPCRMENPNVLAAYERFKEKNFTVLGVSLDQNKASWIKAINDDKLVWYQVSDLKYWNNDVARQYKIQQIPQNFLIDPTGKIVGKNLRGAELDARLCALLGCN